MFYSFLLFMVEIKGKFVLLSDKQFVILKYLAETGYMTGVGRKCDITYSHINKITNIFIKKGLVEKKIGHKNNFRIKTIFLTEKGEKVLDLYFKLFDLLNNNKMVKK